MVVSFDKGKSDQNISERSPSFELVDNLDWSTAVIWEDGRRDYGELRLLVAGVIGDWLHIAVVTPRETDLRVISLRRANRKESRIYAEEIGDRGRAG